jgi:hypothetical protein
MSVADALRFLLNVLLIMTTTLAVLVALFFFVLTAMIAPPPELRAGAQWAGPGPTYGMIATAVAFTSELFRRLFVRKRRTSDPFPNHPRKPNETS